VGLTAKRFNRVRSQVWVTLFVSRLGNTPGRKKSWGVSKKGDTLTLSWANIGMPWKQEKGLQEQRESFVREALGEEKSFGQLCREYQISRKTGYKWCRRAFKEGVGALADQRRGPREGSAGAIEARWKSRIIEQKKASQLGSEKAFYPHRPFACWRKDSLASHYQSNPKTKWISAEWN